VKTAPDFFMSLDLLDAPLRLTWDLHGAADPVPMDIAREVARKLAAAGVFFVFLEEEPLAHPGFAELLALLRDGHCRVTAICRGTEIELAAAGNGPLPDDLLLDAGRFAAQGAVDKPALLAALRTLRNAGADPGLLLVPNTANLHSLPVLADFCRDQGVGRFKLPNVPIDANFGRSCEPPLDPAALREFRSSLAAAGADLGRGLALEVHDLFLWEILFPEGGGERSEYGGCQAGNSVGYVDAAGDLYPCSSWPRRIGSLLEHSLDDLWHSAERFAIRDRIAAVPAGCRGCRDYPVCFGACRGLAEAFAAGAERDPACSGPR